MLEYDEWVVPGEVEYAEKKAAEIESQIKRYHKDIKTFEYWSPDIYFPITEHVVAGFEVIIPYSEWNPLDYDIKNKSLLNWYHNTIAPIDAPKIFDLPAGDIRSTLPEWDESLLPDESCKDIMNEHSTQRNVVRELEEIMEYGTARYMSNELNISEVKIERITEEFLRKLKTVNKNTEFTEMENRVTEYFREKGYFISDCDYFYRYHYGLDPWYFPLDMTEDDIVDAIREAYTNASKRSKRIFPGEVDVVNMCNVCPRYECRFIENYQCLYQGKAGNLVIRFLFDFRNMRIVNAYPVLNKK